MKELKNYLNKVKDFQFKILEFNTVLLVNTVIVFSMTKSAIPSILEGILLFL